MSDMVNRLREASLEDAQSSWMDPAPRWAERSRLLSDAADEIERLLSSPRVEEVRRMREALTALRSLVREGGVPRYTVTPGAALNSVIEELVDPALSPPVG